MKKENLYYNQHQIIVDKPIADGLFTMIKNQDLYDACRILNGAELKMWLYIIKNKDKFKWGLSPAQLESDIGMNKPTCYRAYKGLVEKGYIEEIDDKISICHASIQI